MKPLLLTFSLFFFVLFSNGQWQKPDINLSLSPLESSDIQTVGTTKGDTYIAYYTPFEGNYFIRVQLLNAAGEKQFGDSGIVIYERKSGSATFAFNICVDALDNLFLATQYQKGGEYKVIVNKISPKGMLKYSRNGMEIGTGMAPYPVKLSNGNIAVAWVNGDDINYQVIAGDSTQLWNSPKVLAGGTRPQLVAHSNRSFGIVYQKESFPPFYTNLYEQRIDPKGDPIWANPVQLSDLVTASYRYYSVINEDDTTYVGYFGNPTGSNRFDGYVQRVNPDGVLPWGLNGTEFATYSEISEPNTLSMSVAKMRKSDVIWALGNMSDINQVNYGISVQKLNSSTGERLLGDFAKTVFEINSAAPRPQAELQLCDNNPIFIYTDNTNQLYGCGLDSLGDFSWDPESTILSTNTDEKGRFGFTFPDEGQAVAVWSDSRTGISQPYAQNIGCDGSTGGGVLPIALVNFKGSLSGNIVTLNWETVSEVNNKGFHVERSTDGVNFHEIGFVASKALNGNSSLLLNYSIIDSKPLNGDNFYRLKQEDNDGKYTYSNIILLKVNTAYEFKMKQVYPNPVKNVLNVYVESQTADKVVISIFDANGKIVKRSSENLQAGNNNYQINVATLPAGNYFIQLNGSKQYSNTKQHFLKQ